MTTTDPTNAKVDANCKVIRQLRWLQKEYWESYEHEIAKLVDENETLLKAETKKAEVKSEQAV